MDFLNKTDSHIHSRNSPDSIEIIDNICKQALKQQLIAIAVTDHCECHDYKRRKFNKSIRASILETSVAKEKYGNELFVARGVELGQPHHDTAVAQEVIGSLQLDFVLTSLHRTKSYQNWYSMNYLKTDKEPDYLISHYFEEMLHMIQSGYLDSLAHMTYPLRYMAKQNIYIDLSKHEDEIDLILKSLASGKKALEINVASYVTDLKDASPSQYIVNRFKQLGGQYITVGSDAHIRENIGININKGIKMALDAGFENITVYKNREPQLIPIKIMEG